MLDNNARQYTARNTHDAMKGDVYAIRHQRWSSCPQKQLEVMLDQQQ